MSLIPQHLRFAPHRLRSALILLGTLLSTSTHSHSDHSRTLLLLSVLSTNDQASDTVEVPRELVHAIEDAFDERQPELSRRLEAVAEIDKLFSTEKDAENPSSHWIARNAIWVKARFVEAATNMRLGKLDLALDQARKLGSLIDAQSNPEFWFRCRSLSAAILLLKGERHASVLAHKELLSTPLSSVPRAILDRAKINYAAALYECGQTHEAAELYESVLFSALESSADLTALHAANNLISMLMDDEAYAAANHILQSLQPALDRNAATVPAQSLFLHALEMQRREGSIAKVLTELRSFIHQDPPPPATLLGRAHKLLSDTLRESGDLDLALTHAQQAAQLLKNAANLMPGVRLSTAQILMQRGEYAAVQEILANMLSSSQLVPSRRLAIHQLQLEASLRQSGRDSDILMLQVMLEALQEKEQARATSVSQYMEGKLRSAQQNWETRQARLESLLTANDALAERSIHYWQLAGLIAVGLCSTSLIYIQVRRRSERRQAMAQQTQNARLAELVDAKTRELAANLKSQSDMVQALERKKNTETIGLLAGNIAHEINNLLQVIGNVIATIAKSETTEAQRRNALEVANESIRHGSGIIRQLLAFSRQPALHGQLVNVKDYLRDSRPLLAAAVGSKIELIIHDHSEGAIVHVDPNQLTTTLVSILQNAADATPIGGKVDLTAKRFLLDAHGKTLWNDLELGNYLVLIIEDSGCGMHEEELARAFDPFFTTKNVGEGVGLGLSSAQRFVRNSGGDIRIRSVPEKGTTVELLLPVKEAENAQAKSTMELAGPSLVNKRLLLVEDHAPVAQSLLMLIRHLKLETVWVETGDEAIDLLERDPSFDFILSDVHMPGATDGPALAHWVRAHNKKTRVFLMSGYNDISPEDTDVPLLPKPFNLSQLASFLREHSEPSPQN